MRVNSCACWGRVAPSCASSSRSCAKR
jgi:hypothetical protein